MKQKRELKGIVSGLLVCSMLFGLPLMANNNTVNAATNTEKNLVTNWDFENETATPWGGAANSSVVAGISHNTGNKAGKISGGTQGGHIGQVINVTKNTTYEAKAWVKGENTDAKAIFSIRHAQNGQRVDTAGITETAVNNISDWKEVSLQFNTGNDTQIYFELVKWIEGTDQSAENAKASSLFFDDVSLVNLNPPEDVKYTEVWRDDFDTETLNPQDWDYELGTIRGVEQQHYVNDKENVFMRDGHLILKATDRAVEDQYKNPRGNRQVIYNSGSVRTHGKRDFLYGKIEIKAKLPKGQGVFPAFWTLGSDFTLDGKIDGSQGRGWYDCGEIDIMELTGQAGDNLNGNKTVYQTIHYGGKYTGNGTAYNSGVVFNNDYHVFGINWSKGKMEWYVDDQIVRTVDYSDDERAMAIFSKPQYAQMNLAMGGEWPGNAGTDLAGTEYDIDYISYSQSDQQKADAKEYYDRAPSIVGAQNVTFMQGDIPNLFHGVTSSLSSHYLDVSIDNEYLFKSTGGMTSVDLVYSGIKDDSKKLANLKPGKYNLYYSALPTGIELNYDKGGLPGVSAAVARKGYILTVEKRTLPNDLNKTGVYGDLLSTITLPDGWTWNEPNTVLTDGSQTLVATYNQNGFTVSEDVQINGVSADKAELLAVIEEANTKINNGQNYSVESFEALKTALNQGQSIADKQVVTKQEVKDVIKVMTDAMNALTKPVISDKIILSNDESVAISGKLPEGSKMTSSVLNKEEMNSIIETIQKTDPNFFKNATLEKVYELELTMNNIKYNLDGTVEVSFKLDATMNNKTLGIVYIDNDGKIQTLESVVDNGYIRFKVQHLSKYAIVSYTENNSGGTKPNTPETPKVPEQGNSVQTEDNSMVLGYGMALLTIAGIYVVLKKKKCN